MCGKNELSQVAWGKELLNILEGKTMKSTTMIMLVAVLVLASIGYMSAATAATLVVDANGSADFKTIQSAIDAAWDFDEILVRPGVYKEHINYHGAMVTIKGTDPNDPNVVESTIIDGSGTGSVVIFNNAEGPYSILRGLTIRNGQNGIECTGADTSPLIKQCRVVSNSAAGIACSLAGPTITETIIENNKSVGISASRGEISLCQIRGNGSGKDGDAGLAGCQGLVLSCVVSANNGDGICNHGGIVENALISANLNSGLRFANVCGCNITNCTIVGNKNSGVYFYPCLYNSQFIIRNSIIVLNNGFAFYVWNPTVPTRWKVHVEWTDVWGNMTGDQGGYYQDPSVIEIMFGLGYCSEDPLFAKRGYWDSSMVWHEGEYHLKSKIGRWDTRTETWVQDLMDSPCLDRGDPASPLGEEPLPNGGRVNMGAYGGTAKASMSGGPKPLCIHFPEMDFNKDCKVDFTDLALFTSHWLDCNFDPQDVCR